ncbi:MAG: BatD family protein, partial [Planctomycetales bacterium]|nr:BatD family protein [Planctomycetales bacterium]
MTTRLTVGFNIVLLLTAAAIARPVHGAEVAASISSEDTYVDSPILFRIDVANVKEHMPPVVPKIDGVEVVSVGTPSQRQFTSIVNGRVYEETTLTHAWRLVPRREGMFVVPPIAVHADGKTFYTRKLSFRATQSVTGDLLAVEIAGKEEHIYVGQAMPLTLRIWLKPYSDARRNITLSEADMWRMVNKDRTNWGMFDKAVAELADRNQRPAGNTVTREGDNGRQQTYYLYEIETNVYPKRPGQLDGSDVTIVVDYPTKVERSRDPFDSFLDSPFRSSVPDEMQSMFGPRLRVTAARPISAVAAVAATGVLPIPEAGRPVDYRGAVGRYQVSAQAKPTNVSAGEPITLYFGVQGDGPMDLVQAPPLSEIPELTKDFLVSDEPLAGIVRDDLKMFSTSLRPRRSGITAIPPIPFSFFDPETKRFATVHTSPISITVAESDQLALDDVITNQPSGGAYANSTSTSSGKQHPVERSGQTVVPDLAFHRHLSVLESHSDERPVLEAFLLLVPPVAFLLTWISVGWPHLAGGSRSTRGRQKRALAQLQKA